MKQRSNYKVVLKAEYPLGENVFKMSMKVPYYGALNFKKDDFDKELLGNLSPIVLLHKDSVVDIKIYDNKGKVCHFSKFINKMDIMRSKPVIKESSTTSTDVAGDPKEQRFNTRFGYLTVIEFAEAVRKERNCLL